MEKKIKLTKEKLTYILLGIIILSLAGVNIYALSAGGEGNPGHNIGFVGAPASCVIDDLMLFDGSSWKCRSNDLSTNAWSQLGYGISYLNGGIGIGYSSLGDYRLAVYGWTKLGGELIIEKSNVGCDESSAGMIQYINEVTDTNGESQSILRICMQQTATNYAWQNIASHTLSTTEPPCVPNTNCGAYTCGNWDDGCGDTFNCGTCNADTHYCDVNIGSCVEWPDDGGGSNPPPPGGGSTGGSCFLEGTKITMADKNLKNIEDIKVGEFVLSFDEEKQEYVMSEVKETIAHTEENTYGWEKGYYILKAGSGEMKVTGNHLIYSKKGYVRVDSLLERDYVFVGDHWIKVRSLIYHEKDLDVVYNLELTYPNNYYAEGILVHNLKALGPCEGDTC